MTLLRNPSLLVVILLLPLGAACPDRGSGSDGLAQGDGKGPLAEGAIDGPRAADRRVTDRGPMADAPRPDGPIKLDSLVKDAPAPAKIVDPKTLHKKVLFGYQGWFGCPGDGSQLGAWMHWFNGQIPTAANATVDFWPDVSELGTAETCPTQMTLPSGQPAVVYSAYRAATVERHFKWMQDYGIDGVMLQRFVSELSSAPHKAFRDQVLKNVAAGAEKYGRVFTIMYDIAGASGSTLAATLKADWDYLVDTLKVTKSPSYLHHSGKPVLAVWGLGFTHTQATASDAAQIVAYFKSGAPAGKQVVFMGGVPTYWRTLTGDARSDTAWKTVYLSMDLLSPWSVGRYADASGADSFLQKLITPDLAALKGTSVGYMPVVFPGFSWANLKSGSTPNQIPRLGGTFYWRQVYNAVSAGSTLLYVAMFDEVDEGTAMYKLAPSKAELPAQGTFIPLDIDGQKLPADWYLRLGSATGKVLRGDIALSPSLPISAPCVPACTGKNCGTSDGCGGLCSGPCPTWETCDPQSHTCTCGPAPHFKKTVSGTCLPSCGLLLSKKGLPDGGQGCCQTGCTPPAISAGPSHDCSICCSSTSAASPCQ